MAEITITMDARLLESLEIEAERQGTTVDRLAREFISNGFIGLVHRGVSND